MRGDLYLTCVFCIIAKGHDKEPAITVFGGNATCPDHILVARDIATGRRSWDQVMSDFARLKRERRHG